MKKIILTFIITFFAVANVYAAKGEECLPTEITRGQNELISASFELKYADDVANMDGDIMESRFYLTIPNLPSGYSAIIDTPEGRSYIGSGTDYAIVTGGVFKIEYYSTNCDTLLKKTEFMAPFYKVYCELDDNCEENVWFDGTYENTASNQNRKNDDKLSMRLVIILVILIIIIVLFAAVIYKRRKDYEKSL